MNPIWAIVIGAGVLGVPPTGPCKAAPLGRFEFSQVQMGVDFKIILYAKGQKAANQAATQAFSRISELNAVLSDYDPKSELSRLSNLSRGAPMDRAEHVSADLCRVLYAAQQLSNRSGGAFDVTIGPSTRLWRRARRRGELPVADRLAAAKDAVGFQHLRLDSCARTVQLLRADMRLDLGGIAKGYAADEALKVLKKHGIDRALVDGSGDISIGQPPPGKAGWRIEIAPRQSNAASRFVLLSNTAIATSGDAQQFVVIDDTRYSHIVDPKTGLGLTTPSSVTVVAANGMIADGLASAVSVLGPTAGIELIEATPTAASLIVHSSDDGKAKVFQSDRFKHLPTAD